MVIRAGVDDRSMVSALGVNIQLTFAIAFFVGSALAGFGGAIGGSFASLGPGVDANWLLYSFVVVIVGGMGSLPGAAVGSLLFGLVDQASRPPTSRRTTLSTPSSSRSCCWRSCSPFGPTDCSEGRHEASRLSRGRPSATSVSGRWYSWRSAPLLFSDYWVGSILTQTFLLGVAAASLIFLSAYGGMVSLAQVAIYGIAGFVVGNVVTTGSRRGSTSVGTRGWASLLGIGIATAVAFLFGALASRSTGIYFLMITLTFAVIANYFFGQVTTSRASAESAASARPTSSGTSRSVRDRLYYVALGYGPARVRRHPLRRSHALRARAAGGPRRAGADGLARLQRVAPPDAGFQLRGIPRRRSGVLYVWWNGQIDPTSIDVHAMIDLLVMAVIGGLYRLEGAWLGALAFVVIKNYVGTSTSRSSEAPSTRSSASSSSRSCSSHPTGLMGMWDSLFPRRERTG